VFSSKEDLSCVFCSYFFCVVLCARLCALVLSRTNTFSGNKTPLPFPSRFTPLDFARIGCYRFVGLFLTLSIGFCRCLHVSRMW